MNAAGSASPPTGQSRVRIARRTAAFLTTGLVMSLLLAFAVSRFASSEPDGLTKVAAQHGIDAKEQPHALESTTFAGYGTVVVHDEGLGTGIAGVLGVLVTFCVAAAAVWLAARTRNRSHRVEHTATPP